MVKVLTAILLVLSVYGVSKRLGGEQGQMGQCDTPEKREKKQPSGWNAPCFMRR